MRPLEVFPIFTLTPPNQSLAYYLATRSELQAQFEPTTLHTVSVLPSSPTTEPKLVTRFERAPPFLSVWPIPEEIFTAQYYDPSRLADAPVVHRISLHSCEVPFKGNRFYAGETDTIGSVQSMGTGCEEFTVATEVGLATRVDILNGEGKVFTLYDTGNMESIDEFDVKKVDNGYIVAAIRSSGPRKEAPNVWVGRTSKKETVRKLSLCEYCEASLLAGTTFGETVVPFLLVWWQQAGQDRAD